MSQVVNEISFSHNKMHFCALHSYWYQVFERQSSTGIIIEQFTVYNRGIFLRVTLYYGEPVRQNKIQETDKNILRH